jgi:hypothetical protein
MTGRLARPNFLSERTLVLVGVGALTVLLAAHARWHGALGAARNDDWAYLRVAERLADTGEFRLDGWTHMTFVGQAALAWPLARLFGTSILTFQLTVAGLGAIGLAALWWTVRSWLPWRLAAIVVGLTAVGPLYPSLAISFMTDVPAFAASSLCVLAATRSARSWTPGWFAVMCASGVVSVSIREYGLVPLAVGLVVAQRQVDRSLRRLVALASGATAAACVALLAWRRTISAGGPSTRLELGFDAVIAGIDQFARGLVTLALLVAPVAIAAAIRRGRRFAAHWPPSRTFGVALVALAVWSLLMWRSGIRFVGNYVGARSYSLVEGPLPMVLPGWLDAVAKLVAAVALLAMCLGVGYRSAAALSRPAGGRLVDVELSQLGPRAVVTAMLVATLGVHAALCLATDAPFFDRYLLAPAAWTTALSAHDLTGGGVDRGRRGRCGVLAAGASSAVLLLVSAQLVNSAAALDGGAWRAAEHASEMFDPATIDGGFAWFGYHQDGSVHTGWISGRNWWTSFYPDRPVCATVTAEAADGVNAVRRLFGPAYQFDVEPRGGDLCNRG